MIPVKVKCPHCGRSIMDEENKIDGHPSVKVVIEFGQKRGVLWLSSLYGSYNIDSEFEITVGKTVRFFCPDCEAELKSTRSCEECQAPMVPLKLVGGGIIEICSRRGCKKHLVEFEDIETALREFYNTYSLFFKGK